ncbi:MULTISPECIES: SMI1/KNR4 family protein [unclassified Streptomyces]|uniref:SMI1/KNR4 family protein n=1 Tax=unclassified Streptomyces TaxID=2593676 RepID=UPI0035DEF953
MEFNAYREALAETYLASEGQLELSSSASIAELRDIENDLGFSLDPGLRAAWLEADGGPNWIPVFARPGYLSGYHFLSIEAATARRRSMKRNASRYADYLDPRPRDPRIGAGWFNEGWLPFAELDGGTGILIQDYCPTHAGTLGQIIAYTHDPDEMSYVAPSFEDLLEESIAEISAYPEEYIPEPEEFD